MKNLSKALLSRTSLAVLILLGSLGHAHAAVFSVPEIDASVATSGVALLGGVILMIRGRRR